MPVSSNLQELICRAAVILMSTTAVMETAAAPGTAVQQLVLHIQNTKHCLSFCPKISHKDNLITHFFFLLQMIVTCYLFFGENGLLDNFGTNAILQMEACLVSKLPFCQG